MDKITSADGTTIAYHKQGSGPPLILVAGTGAANPTAWPVFMALAQRFTVFAVDRRGRGESGDAQAYALEREFEDIAAVVAAAGEPAHLLGHSYGALIALEAALLAANLRKLILYEPWIPQPGVQFNPNGTIERLEDLLAEGDREEVLRWHYQQNVGMTPREFEEMKASPAWSSRLATAHTLPREMRAEAQYRFDPQRFQDWPIPTLLLLGGDSPLFVRESSERIAKALPNSQIATLPGQQHIAIYTAPELFLREVLGFLSA